MSELHFCSIFRFFQILGTINSGFENTFYLFLVTFVTNTINIFTYSLTFLFQFLTLLLQIKD